MSNGDCISMDKMSMKKAPFLENFTKLMNSLFVSNVTLKSNRKWDSRPNANQYQSGLQQQPQPWGQVHDETMVSIISEHLNITATVEQHDLQGWDGD
ncbi:hypothetical protein DPMN_019128 [Dreissena polymorpha]|uniref:Uncharacterized protein n=1 Tax=Dreissena polymorpha TaxID=45954 RepID=A0A9D4NHV4_DREPO|nr:hypothetical protein DPMN_019128 [Dreissena polymorpha]